MPAKKDPLPPVGKKHWAQNGDKPQWEEALDILKAHPEQAFTVQEIADLMGRPAQKVSAIISAYRHRMPIVQESPREGEKAVRYQFDPKKPDGLAPTMLAKKETLPVLLDQQPGPASPKANGHKVNGVQRRKAHVTNEIFARVLYNGADFTLLETQNGDIIKGRVLR